MKKLLMSLFLISLVMLGCCGAVAEEANFYTVTYDSNGHGGTLSMQSKIPGVDLVLTTSTPGQMFYVFCGWATTPDATKAEYMPGDIYSKDENLTLYAVWKDAADLGVIRSGETYSISFPLQAVTSYLKFTVSEDGFYQFKSTDNFYSHGSSSRTGIYTKNPWGSGDRVASASFIYDESGYSYRDFVITANLTAGTTYYLEYYNVADILNLTVSSAIYTVSYDSNGHGSAPSPQTKEKGVDLVLSTSTPGQMFYVFCGWATTPDATQAEYMPGDIYSKDENLTLYAVWKDAAQLEEITSITTTTTSFPLLYTSAYLKFKVSESGAYRFQSTGNYYSHGSSSGTGIYTKNSFGGRDRVASASFIYDESGYSYRDFVITADLTAGTTYYLEYYNVENTLTLHITPQYSDPNPYTASSAVPRSVSIIADSAFEGCGFESFQVPAGTASIGARAFANCPNLRKVVISSADVAIADDAFAGCTDLLIVAPKNSTAHQYAKAHGLEFRALP